ncbi:hypothetical protein TNCT_253221 [Trichonephila clavata]|uniref:Uncharacterized protein n=1 Tax=Trichonephila clavata TaxID=2740835 RepID=A0A8X6FXN6_TRICU|nr:hypothetical protein TNCT_253221 [Trichonephila clavata]
MGRPPGTRKQREGRSVPGHKLSYASRKLFMIRAIPGLADLKGFQSSMCITSYHPPMTESNVPQDLVYLFFSCGWNVLFFSYFSTREFCSNVCVRFSQTTHPHHRWTYPVFVPELKKRGENRRQNVFSFQIPKEHEFSKSFLSTY